MRILKVLFLVFIFTCTGLAYATETSKKPLRVAVTFFTPPFIDSTGNGTFMGFDVNMLAYICYYLQRDCQYKAMEFAELIPSLQTNSVDIAVSGIIITPDRALQISMSTPYLISASRFLTTSTNQETKLTRDTLQGKTIGVEKGSVFGEQIRSWGIKKVKLVEYQVENEEVLLLSQGKLDYILMDNYTAIYWQKQSNGKLKLIGEQVNYGYGYGIAVNPQVPGLLQEINAALNSYVRSQQYRENYELYFGKFQQ